MSISSITLILVIITVGIVLLRKARRTVVGEDHVAITVNKDGFIKRVLPQGRHMLRPFERVEFRLKTKAQLVTGQAMAITTRDGIPTKISWSGIYRLQPALITESRSQRLRGLTNADKAIARSVDLLLRKLIGALTVQTLFEPAVRERLERQLGQVAAGKLEPLGIVFISFNLQTIDLPAEVTEALNKAKAIETLDGAIRQLDPTTREVVRGVYQLDEILHWDQYLPVPSRHAMKRLS